MNLERRRYTAQGKDQSQGKGNPEDGKGNGHGHGVMEAPAYGRRMTRCALLGFENPVDERRPSVGHPSKTIYSTRRRRPVTQGEPKARGIHNSARRATRSDARLPARLRN